MDLTPIYGPDWKPDHTLKTWPAFFQQAWDRKKPFELRKDDRDFEAGQSVLLEEWIPPHQEQAEGRHTGRWILGPITNVVRDAPHFGLMPGFCVFSYQEQFRSSHDEQF